MIALVTSIGSISADFVIKTLKNKKYNVIGIDMYPEKWIANSKKVDKFYQVPQTKSKSYEKQLINICRKNNVKIIVPLSDLDVDYFNRRRKLYEYEEVIITISSKNVIKKIRNKLNVYNIFKETNVNVIPTFKVEDYDIKSGIYPCIAKPEEGRSSEGQVIIKNKEELKRYLKEGDLRIFQPFINGEVYVVDLFKNGNEAIKYVVRKELTRTKNGAGIAVEIIKPEEILVEYIEKISEFVKFQGVINIEFIKDKNENYYLMDINPRPSAGIVYSSLAGYNFVSAHVSSFMGEKIKIMKDVKFGEIYTRKFTEVKISS